MPEVPPPVRTNSEWAENPYPSAPEPTAPEPTAPAYERLVRLLESATQHFHTNRRFRESVVTERALEAARVEDSTVVAERARDLVAFANPDVSRTGWKILDTMGFLAGDVDRHERGALARVAVEELEHSSGPFGSRAEMALRLLYRLADHQAIEGFSAQSGDNRTRVFEAFGASVGALDAEQARRGVVAVASALKAFSLDRIVLEHLQAMRVERGHVFPVDPLNPADRALHAALHTPRFKPLARVLRAPRNRLVLDDFLSPVLSQLLMRSGLASGDAALSTELHFFARHYAQWLQTKPETQLGGLVSVRHSATSSAELLANLTVHERKLGTEHGDQQIRSILLGGSVLPGTARAYLENGKEHVADFRAQLRGGTPHPTATAATAPAFDR